MDPGTNKLLAAGLVGAAVGASVYKLLNGNAAESASPTSVSKATSNCSI